MKKVLSALLAMLMVVSCMAGITFSVAAAGTETIALYKGETTESQYGGTGATGNSIGQVLTIPAGKALVSIAYPITYTYDKGTQPGTINVWQWNGAKGELLYTGDFSFANNAKNSVITIKYPEIANITGTIYYEIAYNDPSVCLAVGGSTQGPADGVTNYYNGSVNDGKDHWASSAAKYGIGSTITVQNAAGEVITSMKLAGEASTTQYNWERAATKIGQRFTVPACNVLTGYTIGKLNDYEGWSNTGRLAIYQWNNNYAISTAAEPLFSMEFAGYNGEALEAVIPADKKIGGEVIAVITYLSGNGKGWKPQGGTEAVEGVYHYADGYAYAGSTNAKGICSSINFEKGEAVIKAPKYNKVPLYTGASNTDGQFSNDSFKDEPKQTVGQKFTLDGEILAGISFDMLRTYDNDVVNNRGVLKVYVWDTDYATTVASAPKYSVEFANHRNDNAKAFAIPTELGLTGTLYWEIECLEASSGMKHGYVPGTGAAKAGVESFRNGAAITGVWTGEKNIGCDVFTLDMEETSYPLYTEAGTTQYTGNNRDVTIGQTAIIPAGKILTAVDFGTMRVSNYNNGLKAAHGTFSVYQWTGDYAETVSRTPLYTADISVLHDNALKIEIPASLMIEGNILWVLDPDATDSESFNPDASCDQIAGTLSYTNGVAQAGPWSNKIGEEWKAAYIKCTLGLVDGGICTEGATESVGLYNGTANVNVLWGNGWGVENYGQKFTVPAGKTLKAFTYKLNVGGGDGKGSISFYIWQGTLSATLKTMPVYTADISIPSNDTVYTVNIPSDVKITGEVLWYIDTGDDFSPVAFGATEIGTDVLDIVNGQYTTLCGGNWQQATWGANAFCPTMTYETASVTYINSIDKTVIYSGSVAYGKMLSAAKTEFRANANKYANGTWGAWDGTFTPAPGAPGVYYTNHTYADTVIVDGVATDLNGKNYLTVEANPSGFVGWQDNTGAFLSNSAVMKWFPKSADATLTAVYEGEFAPTVSATATIKNGLLTVVVTPTLDSSVSEYGYYISTTGPIDTQALEGVTKVTANNAFAAYLQRVYNLKPATTNVYVLPYIVVNGNVVYGTPVSVAR